MFTFSLNSDVHSALLGTNILNEKPRTSIGLEWWSEVIFKRLDAKVDEKVDLDAYGFVCSVNTEMNKRKREVALLTMEDINLGAKGVSEVVASAVDLNFDLIFERSEIDTLIKEFVDLQEQVSVDYGTNLWRTIKLALTGNEKMIKKLRGIVEAYSAIELMSSILSNAECLDKLGDVLI